jgi:hypothetical protein
MSVYDHVPSYETCLKLKEAGFYQDPMTVNVWVEGNLNIEGQERLSPEVWTRDDWVDFCDDKQISRINAPLLTEIIAEIQKQETVPIVMVEYRGFIEKNGDKIPAYWEFGDCDVSAIDLSVVHTSLIEAAAKWYCKFMKSEE